jgi:hypothetical protein
MGSATATQAYEVVSRPDTCQAVLNAAMRMLRQYEPSWRKIEQAGYDFTVLQYGSYYALLISYKLDPATGLRPHYIPLMVFRAGVLSRGGTLSYVTTILV